MSTRRMTARVVYRSGDVVCFDLYGHGEIGKRGRIGFAMTKTGAETDDLLDRLDRGGWQIIDAADLVGLGVDPRYDELLNEMAGDP